MRHFAASKLGISAIAGVAIALAFVARPLTAPLPETF